MSKFRIKWVKIGLPTNGEGEGRKKRREEEGEGGQWIQIGNTTTELGAQFPSSSIDESHAVIVYYKGTALHSDFRKST